MSSDSNSDGMGSGTEFDTMRGRDYPTVRQFTVFLENRVGQLLGIIRRFERGGVRIVAININDATECCVVRFLLSDPEKGREIIERAGLAMIESDLIAVQLPETSQPLVSVCSALLQAEVNLIQAIPLLMPENRSNAVAMMVDDLDMASDTLERMGFQLLHEDDLA